MSVASEPQKHVKSDIRLSDYSLVGADASREVEQGLAEAEWYQSPVPRGIMRELLERRDGSAIRDTLIWFGLLILFGSLGAAWWETGWAILPFAAYGIIYGSTSDSRWHETGHGTAFKTDWMNNTLYEIASFVEHHMFPLVPYHNLPRLHEIVKEDMPEPYPNIFATFREIVPAVLRQVRDPAYFVRR